MRASHERSDRYRRRRPCHGRRTAHERGAASWLGLAGLVLLLAAVPARASPWSTVATPTPGPPRVIGRPVAGCIAGAVPLPAQGPGFEVIRLSRHRYFGHPATVAFVERLGRRAAVAGLPPFYVGDMAQPRGGPLPYGHASHETGIDVDIWFNLDRKPALPPAAREDVPLPSMVRADGRAIDPARFGARQVALLRWAARDPAVDRIFVNWTIKQALCEGYGGSGTGDRSWLHRIRPWYGHEAHFHVRLKCPADSKTTCIPQAPVPPGLGCDATLAWWAHRPPPAPVAPRATPRLPRRLPAECLALLRPSVR